MLRLNKQTGDLENDEYPLRIIATAAELQAALADAGMVIVPRGLLLTLTKPPTRRSHVAEHDWYDNAVKDAKAALKEAE